MNTTVKALLLCLVSMNCAGETTLALEMSLTTPPFGLLLFLMLGVAPRGTTLQQVALAAIPYLLSDAVLLVLLIAFPAIALYLPGLL